MKDLAKRLQDITGKLPEGVEGTRVVTELSGDVLHMVGGGNSTETTQGWGRDSW